MHWFLDPITKHYFDFSGRATRQQFWMFQLSLFLIGIILFMLVIAFMKWYLPFLIFSFALFIFFLFTLLPQWTTTARRLHDVGWSAWWLLLNFVPFGGFVIFILMLVPGVTEDNQYGPSPYGGLKVTSGASPMPAPSSVPPTPVTPQAPPTPTTAPTPTPTPTPELPKSVSEENTQRGYGG